MTEFAVDLRKTPIRFTCVIALTIVCAGDLAAQGSGNANLLLFALIILAALLLVGAVMQIADNYLRVEARRHSVQSEGLNLWGPIASIFSPQLPARLKDKQVHLLKAGFDMKLEGAPAHSIGPVAPVTRYAVQPVNFKGLSPIPKMLVEIGESVKAGQPVFVDKTAPDIKYVAPVSGEVLEINRGAKRAITEVVILADKTITHLDHQVPDLGKSSREDLVAFLKESGAWLLLRQRPYNVIAQPETVPVNIFISTFDTAPLAPDANLIVQGKGDEFQAGLDVLQKLTAGDVFLGLDGRGAADPSAIFTQAKGVVKHWFRGPHPSGNVGVQIHHAAPLKTSDKAWTLGVQEVFALGRLWMTGRFDGRRIVALTGGPLKTPQYVQTYIGAHLGELLKNNVYGDNLRFISGDVLSGEQKTTDSYLNFYDDQVTVMKEGNTYELFGWLMPLTERPSVSRTFPNFLFDDVKMNVNTNTHGEKRAFVMTGQYEQMLPMNIYPQHLMKAIMANDIERMEGLGIHELAEEDIALCEFSCTSKMPLQEILRTGQEMMMEQS
jgi:Na+-transporting NADH:ubiquinone oxidoreductase subunit A